MAQQQQNPAERLSHEPDGTVEIDGKVILSDVNVSSRKDHVLKSESYGGGSATMTVAAACGTTRPGTDMNTKEHVEPEEAIRNDNLCRGCRKYIERELGFNFVREAVNRGEVLLIMDEADVTPAMESDAYRVRKG